MKSDIEAKIYELNLIELVWNVHACMDTTCPKCIAMYQFLQLSSHKLVRNYYYTC